MLPFFCALQFWNTTFRTMNFLGHIFFSNGNKELMTANIYGDFVRGSDLSSYPEIIQEGVVLHRMIDSYIDNHPIVKELMHQIYPDLPKVTGIAVDIYFDHLLAKNWEKYSSTPLREFLDNYYESLLTLEYEYPLEFQILLGRMRTGDWLWHYRETFGLDKACRGVSQRISFDNVLDQGLEVFNKHEVAINQSFEAFMQEAITYFNNYFSK